MANIKFKKLSLSMADFSTSLSEFLLCDITSLKLRLAQRRCQAWRNFSSLHSLLGLISRVFKFRLTIHFSSLNGTLDWISYFSFFTFSCTHIISFILTPSSSLAFAREVNHFLYVQNNVHQASHSLFYLTFFILYPSTHPL